MTSPAARAIAHVRRRAETARARAAARIAEILFRAGEAPSTDESVITMIRERAEVTLNFHPDRIINDGRTVAEALLQDGRYKSQFETGVSSGSRTAWPGGDRDRWEDKLFGGAYQNPPAAPDERPKYGALDLMRHPDGGSPRFGSCYLVLRHHMKAKCTFTWGDSHVGPEHLGTIDRFEPVMAALLEEAETRGEVLGVSGMNVSALLHAIPSQLVSGPRQPAASDPRRALDHYIEAQIHGPIKLSHDVEALVIDPAFEGTITGSQLREICDRFSIVLLHHAGFVLALQEVPDDFRGPRMIPLSQRIAHRFARTPDEIDAVALGRADQDLHLNPAAWADWGPHEETWQHIKQLWHVLVRFGRPRAARH